MIESSVHNSTTPGDKLSHEQAKIYKRLIGGENLFITGGAGTGKSHLVKYFLRDKDRETFPVLASTGAAAVLVGGRTFHSFFGLGILEGGVQATVAKALRNPRLIRRLKRVAGVIIDEISMLDGDVIAAAEEIARRARSSDEPWGGMQVVAVGDFYQLPPVNKPHAQRVWAFQHRVWEAGGWQTCLLTENLRSASDPDLVQILNYVRRGIVNPQVRQYLDDHTRALTDEKTMRLYPRRAQADAYNLERLAGLAGEEHRIATIYVGAKHFVEQLKRTAPIGEEVVFKIGALVMLRQNDPQSRWVNGSIGTVKAFDGTCMQVELKNGRLVTLDKVDFSMMDADGDTVASATNFPINLAYAATIHKAQGATLDGMIVDLKSLWEPGHAYVALSRVRRGKDLYITRWDEGSIKVDRRVAAFYDQFSGSEIDGDPEA